MENSHIREQLAEVLPGADTQQAFRFAPLRFHWTPMLHEALLITRQEGDVLNKKEEYSRLNMPGLIRERKVGRS